MAEPEQERIAARAVVRVVAAVFAAVAIALVVVAVMNVYFERRHPAAMMTYSIPGEPRIGPAPAEEMKRYRALQREHLSSYGWTDRERGYAHIPIEQAMKRYATQAKRSAEP